MKSSLIGFHFGPDFNVSSDQQISEFRVALRVAEGFFILVLIFMYLQISIFADLALHLEQMNGFSFWFLFSGIFRSAGFVNIEAH